MAEANRIRNLTPEARQSPVLTGVALLPVFVSALLLAAHFSRANMTPLVLLSLGFPALLLIRRRWAARTVQVLLLLGGVEWLRTLWVLAWRRSASGDPWARLVAILAVVAAFTLASALVFGLRGPKARYLL